jgi:hypothetical protein
MGVKVANTFKIDKEALAGAEIQIFASARNVPMERKAWLFDILCRADIPWEESSDNKTVTISIV